MADLSKAFESGARADIVFSVGGEDILAHSLILYFRSPVFKTMFDGPMAPKGENDEKPVIKINDERISAKDFRTFLLFLYNNKAEITGENAFALLNMAKMYDVAELFRLCEEFLTKSLTSENVFTIANSASIFDDSEVFKTAVEFIVTKSDVLRNEQKYYEINNEVLCAVLKQDKIPTLMDPYCRANHPSHVNGSNCSYCGRATATEVDLFNLMLKWGKNQCKLKNLEENPENLREILKSCLPFIRFATMSCYELSNVVYPTKLLDNAVMATIFVDVVNLAQHRTTNESPFSKVKRSFF
uniref:BTB domain-containing protein n=1 Tax=Panagrolaimus sp. JU765 TaxID=591449 RepID=A0AC34QTK1_9BILA